MGSQILSLKCCAGRGPGLTVMSPEGRRMERKPQGHGLPARPPGGRCPALRTECVCPPKSCEGAITPTSRCQEVGLLGGAEVVRVQPS